jgi:hypothetical protein
LCAQQSAADVEMRHETVMWRVAVASPGAQHEGAAATVTELS